MLTFAFQNTWDWFVFSSHHVTNPMISDSFVSKDKILHCNHIFTCSASLCMLPCFSFSAEVTSLLKNRFKNLHSSHCLPCKYLDILKISFSSCCSSQILKQNLGQAHHSLAWPFSVYQNRRWSRAHLYFTRHYSAVTYALALLEAGNDSQILYRGVDKSLAWPDWKNNWKVTIFCPTQISLLLWRPGWTDNLLNFFFEWLAKVRVGSL